MPIDPLIGSALISGGSSLLSGIGNIFGQQSVNQTNIKLQQMQNNWNERMWRLNNQYNDPSAQMARLIKAGISPTFAGQTIEGGNSSSPAQGTNPAQVSNPYQNIGEPFQQTASTILNAYATESQTKLNESQKDLNETRAANETRETAANILLKGRQAGLFASQKAFQDIINSFQHQKSSTEIRLMKAQVRTEWAKAAELYSQAKKNRDEAALARANKKFVEIQADIYPYLTQAQIVHLKTTAAAAWQHAVNETTLTPYQKSVLLSQKAMYANQAMDLKSVGEMRKIEKELADQLGIPPAIAAQLLSATLLGVTNLLGTMLNPKNLMMLGAGLTP